MQLGTRCRRAQRRRRATARTRALRWRRCRGDAERRRRVGGNAWRSCSRSMMRRGSLPANVAGYPADVEFTAGVLRDGHTKRRRWSRLHPSTPARSARSRARWRGGSTNPRAPAHAVRDDLSPSCGHSRQKRPGVPGQNRASATARYSNARWSASHSSAVSAMNCTTGFSGSSSSSVSTRFTSYELREVDAGVIGGHLRETAPPPILTA